MPKVSIPLTKSDAKRLPIPDLHTQSVKHSDQEMDKDQVHSEDKDKIIRDLKDHLKEVQHVISQSYHENREMKIKLVERVSNIQTPQDEMV